MRFTLSLVVVGLLAAVVGGWLPLAWGFVAVAILVFLGYWSIYDLLTPVARIEQDDD